jgi:hypothetical protein
MLPLVFGCDFVGAVAGGKSRENRRKAVQTTGAVIWPPGENFREVGMERLEFLIEGSQGDEYFVVFEVNGGNANAFCTCQAGSNGLYCKHRFGIMDGDVSCLLSDNTADVVRLKGLMKGSDLENAYNRVLEAEAIHTTAKRNLDAAKKALAKAMYR